MINDRDVSEQMGETIEILENGLVSLAAQSTNEKLVSVWISFILHTVILGSNFEEHAISDELPSRIFLTTCLLRVFV